LTDWFPVCSVLVSEHTKGAVYQVVEGAEQLAGKSIETRLQNPAQQRAGHIARSSFMP
jgi:hypothetical protein